MGENEGRRETIEQTLALPNPQRSPSAYRGENRSDNCPANLTTLPEDVLVHVFELLDDVSLSRLRSVSHHLNHIVTRLGIPIFLAHHPLHHISVWPPARDWPPSRLYKYNGRIERALATHSLHAVQLGNTWSQSAIPTISLSPDRLVLGVGTRLIIHPLIAHKGSGLPRAVGPGREYPVAHKCAGSRSDIVGVHELSGGSLAVAQFNGTLQRLEPGSSGLHSTAHYNHPRNVNIHNLTGSGDWLMTTTSTSLVSLFRARSPWVAPETLKLPPGTRAWSSLLSPKNSVLGPSALLGLSGGIHIYSIGSAGGLVPLRVLHGLQPEYSSPYGLVLPPERSSHHPGTLLSAWHDTYLRIHDVRDPSPQPKLALHDPWSDTAMYCAAFVGEWGVAGGHAQHGTVSVWDIRFPRSSGWSVFSPGGKGSPVYALAGEGGRLWGVTERRAFVLALDDSGHTSGGLVVEAARAPPPLRGAKEFPSGYRRRGGKWGWTVRYGEHAEREVTMGYEHSDGMSLFDTRLPVY